MSKTKIEELEGAISVEDDITPITRKPIEQVDSSDWNDVSVAELQNQKAILMQRMQIAAQYSPNMVQQIQRGIAQLDALINSKSNENTGLI